MAWIMRRVPPRRRRRSRWLSGGWHATDRRRALDSGVTDGVSCDLADLQGGCFPTMLHWCVKTCSPPRSYRAGFQNLGQFYRQFGLLVQTRKLSFKGPVALNNCTSSVGWFTVYYDLGEFFSFHPISHFFFKHTSFTHAINVERALKVIRCLAQGHFGDALGVNLLPVLCTR